MNLVSFWQQQVSKWNDEQKCDLCWSFGAPLIESAVSVQQLKDCCVQVLLLRDKGNAFSMSTTYDNTTGLITAKSCIKSFQLLVVIPGELGVNNFNEIPNHSTDESNWSTKLSKLEECLSCDANLNFCEFLGRSYRVTNWSAVQVLNEGDNCYIGYRLNVSFTDVK